MPRVEASIIIFISIIQVLYLKSDLLDSCFNGLQPLLQWQSS